MVQDTSSGSPISAAYVKAITVAATGSANQPPSVSFTGVVTNLTVNFTDQTTSDASTIVSWLWAFGDGATSTDQNPTHAYSMAGTFTVTLTATDALGNSASNSIQVLTSMPGSSGSSDAATYILKGFMGDSAFVDNTNDVIASLGELSTYSKTFSRDTAQYGAGSSGEVTDAITMTVFNSVNANGAYTSVPSDYADALLGMAVWLFAQAQAGAFTSDAAGFRQAFLSQYSDTIQSVSSGPMVTQASVWLPTYVEFYFQNPSSISPSNTSNSRVKVWFSDSAFRNEYDIYQIAYIPPIANLDNFFNSATSVAAEVAARTLPQTAALVQQAANGDPYTILEASIFNWVDPANSTHLIPTNWTYIIWGQAGNNVDAIKQGLQQYILDNSTHSRAEWAALFPDIFQTTEFILTPFWSQYAIPNDETDNGMYSPVVNPNQALQYAMVTAIGTGYTPQFVQNYMNIVPVAYKSMAMIAVGGPQNEGGVSEFAKQWTDYLDVPTTSTDFDRMQEDTQSFVMSLSKLLLAAENMTEASDLPANITRLTRTNAAGDLVMYACSSYNNIDYLCVTKEFMIQKYGANTNTTGSLAVTYDGIFVNGAYQLLSAVTTMQLQFVAVNAVLPATFSVVGTTANAVSIDTNSGLLTATFPTVGLYTITLLLVDAQGHASQQTFTFNYQQPNTGTAALAISGASFPATGQTGVAYNGTALISGGTAPYSVLMQTLPAGLTVTIDNSQLTVSGTPSVTGTTTCSITVKDSAATPAQTNTSWNLTISGGV
jgi:PKD repeat protein